MGKTGVARHHGGQSTARSREERRDRQTSEQTLNMWTLYVELLVLLNFVSATVIPDHRKISERTDNSDRIDEDNSSLTRKKRDAYFDNIMSEEVFEDPRIWNVHVCETITRRSFLSSSRDESGSRILVLSPRYSTSSTYEHYIETHRCVQPDQVIMVGGVNVKCVQRYLKETLVVQNAGREIYKRPIFLPSGCEAMMERRR